MRKYVFIILGIGMALVLIGLVLVQVSWLNKLLRTKEDIFRYEVNGALKAVSEQIQNKELRELYARFIELTKNEKHAKEAAVSSIEFEQIDTTTNEKFTYKRKILEQKYKVPKDLLLKDSMPELSRNYAKKDVLVSTQIINEKQRKLQYKIIEHEWSFKELTALERDNLKDLLLEQVKHSRIELHLGIYELKYKIIKELQSRDIYIDFEFAVYKGDSPTSIATENFDPDYPVMFKTALFQTSAAKSPYSLLIYFPKKKTFLLSSIIKNLILSIIFILFITGVFGVTLHQLNKQRKIDSIKTDFINNMTHEFKTPIATINLALDSILNPKVLENSDRITQYVEMIREENKRMNHQVENVLRVAKLEKQDSISTEELDIHEMIEEAISHIQLKAREKNGIIKTSLKATKKKVRANAFHTVNLLLNILDNAIKYSRKNPVVIVSTYNSDHALYIHIKDNGIGISKKAQKYIFDKFYREETGNIHNTKGHGLGLAYVKSIVELQNGEISVKSEINKGTTFIIKFPLAEK